MNEGNLLKERYPLKQSKYSSHAWLVEKATEIIMSGKEMTVLDFGCARGDLLFELKHSKVLQDSSHMFYGVELEDPDASIARNRGLEVFTGDIEVCLKKFKKGSIDLIILGDVLEHLVNPLNYLMEFKSLLSTSGKMLITIPNIAFIYVRLMLLFGRWNYVDRGPLDRTHLRFFTVSSFAELVRFGGLTIEEQNFSSPPLEVIFMNSNLSIWKYLEFLTRILTVLMPKLFGYQLLAIVRNSVDS